MSKRKAKYKSKAERATEAVPDEVLAEGSGGTAVHVQADEAGAEVRVEAASEAELVEPTAKRGKREKPAPTVEPQASEAPVEASPEAPKKRKRGKQAHADDASNEELAELVSEAVQEQVVESGEVVFDATAADDEAPPTDDGAPMEASVDGEALTDDGAPMEASADEVEVEVEVEGVMPTSAASLDDRQLRHLVEALVFAADKPITVQRLRQLTRVADVRRLETALSELQAEYTDRGVVLQQVSGGYQFRTQTKFSTWVQQLIQGRPVRLSRAQLETLAIVAYRQPITRPEIDDIRGVDSSATLKLLMDRTLIRMLGKREEVGRPTLYGTTKEFLDFFSLGDLRELPTLREYSELTDESRKVMKDRLGIEPGGGGGSGGGEPGSAPPSDDGGGAPPGDSSPSDASAASVDAGSDEGEAEVVASEGASTERVEAQDATVEHVSESDSVFARYAQADATIEGDGAPELIGEADVADDSEHIGSAPSRVAFAGDAADEDAPVATDEQWPEGSVPIAKTDYGLEPSAEAAEPMEADAGVVPTDEAVDEAPEPEPTRD